MALQKYTVDTVQARLRVSMGMENLKKRRTTELDFQTRKSLGKVEARPSCLRSISLKQASIPGLEASNVVRPHVCSLTRRIYYPECQVLASSLSLAAIWWGMWV